MFALWPRCTKRWIDRIYREVGSARVRERPVVMIIVAKKVTIMLLVKIKMVHGLNILGG